MAKYAASFIVALFLTNPAFAVHCDRHGLEIYRQKIIATASAQALDPYLVAAVACVESNFQHNVVSSAGAYGLMQLMPGTAEELGVDRRNPDQNLHGGARYLRIQLIRFRIPRKALWAYHCGPGCVARNEVPAITRAYADRVFAAYRMLRAEGRLS